MSDDNPLGTALWLVAGGAAGFAAGKWIVAPYLAQRSTSSGAASPPTSIAIAAMKKRQPRSLGGGPSGPAIPIDPYADIDTGGASPAHGPSGAMQPIDPYTPLITVPVITTAPATTTSVIAPVAATTPLTTPPRPTLAASTTTHAPGKSGAITLPSQLEIGSTSGATGQTDARGPITRPWQLVAGPPRIEPKAIPSTATAAVALPTKQLAPSARHATSPRVRQFDAVFARYRGTLPIEYVRALVERESNGQPSARAGSAIGLMQIVPVVLADYNKRHGTTYRSEHLTDPAINVAIGCELLRLIVQSYSKHHPRTLHTDWENPQFVELLTFGYNAGFSEAGGVGRVARYLEGLGAVDITIDQVSAHARLAGASKHLSNSAKVAWCKTVVALYQRERSLARPFASS